MSEPESYRKIGRHAVFYVDVHTGGKEFKQVGIARGTYPDIMLEPKEALYLLSWLRTQETYLHSLNERLQ